MREKPKKNEGKTVKINDPRALRAEGGNAGNSRMVTREQWSERKRGGCTRYCQGELGSKSHAGVTFYSKVGASVYLILWREPAHYSTRLTSSYMTWTNIGYDAVSKKMAIARCLSEHATQRLGAC